MNDNCGIIMYNETSDVNQTLDTDYGYAGYGRRRRRRNRHLQAVAATQEVAGIGPESIKEVFNEAMVRELDRCDTTIMCHSRV
mmetsp:Transcript_64128/g.71642  ORF Transcript_64128/g.71642 Transcript_64128/m.71642 type:complete len:83 (-) Transcript_64128:2-250(-)